MCDIGASTVAERTGVDRSTIHRIITGQTKRPGDGLLRQLKDEVVLHERRRRRIAPPNGPPNEAPA